MSQSDPFLRPAAEEFPSLCFVSGIARLKDITTRDLAERVTHLCHIVLMTFLLCSVVWVSTVEAKAQEQQADSSSSSVKYVSTSQFSIPFEIAPANEPRLKAVLLLQDRETGGWNIWKKEAASKKMFSLTGVKDGEYRLAVRSFYDDDPGAIERIDIPNDPELVVVVDSRAPALVLTLVQTGWNEPQIECVIAERNPDPASLRVFSVPSAPGKSPQQLAAKIMSFKNEGRHWICRIHCPLRDGVSRIRVELRDRAGNLGREDLAVSGIRRPAPIVRASAVKNSTSEEDSAEAEADDAADHTELPRSSAKKSKSKKPEAESTLFTDREISGIGWQNPDEPPKSKRKPPVIRLLSGSQSVNGDEDGFVDPQLALPPYEDMETLEGPAPEDEGDDSARPGLLSADETPSLNSLEPIGPLVPEVPQAPQARASIGVAQPLRSSETQDDSTSVADYDILLRSARNSVALGEIEQALTRFRECIKLEPGRVDARREYAHLLASREQAAAIPVLESVLNTDPADSKTAAILAGMLLRTGKNEKAEAVLKNATALVSNDPELNRLMVQVLVARGRTREAGEYFDQHLSGANTFEPAVRKEIISTLMLLGRLDEALPLAQAAANEIPGDLATTKDLISLLVQLGQFDAAAGAASALNLDDPDSCLEAITLARTLSGQGQYTTAQMILKRAFEVDPLHPDALLAEADLLLRQGFIEGARSSLERGKFSPEDPRVLELRARIHLAAGEFSQARVIISSLLSRTSDVPMILLQGRLYEAMTAFDLGEQNYQSALATYPENAELRNALANLYLQTGHEMKALAVLESSLQQRSQNPVTWRFWVQAAIRNGESTNALARVLAELQNPESSAMFSQHLHRLAGCIYFHQKNVAAATTEFGFSGIEVNCPTDDPDSAYACYMSLLANGEAMRADAFLSGCLTNPAFGTRLVAIAEKNLEYPLAKRIVLELSERYPGNQTVLEQFSSLMSRLGDPSAQSAYQALLERAPLSVPARHGMALMHWRNEDFEQSMQFYDAVLSDVPEHRDAALDRARLLRQWQGREAAIAGYTEAEDALNNPILSDVHRSLLDDPGLVRSNIGFSSLSTEQLFALRLERQATFLSDWRPDNTTAALRRLQELNPDDSHAAFLLAQQNISMGRYAEAADALEKLLARDPLHAQAAIALERTRQQLRPRLGSHFSTFSQSGRNGLSEISRTRFGARYFKPVGTGNDVFSIGYSHIMLRPTGSDHVLGNSLDLGYLWNATPNFRVNAQMNVEQYDEGFSTKPVFRIDAKHRVLDGLELGFVGHMENVAENSESIAQEVFRYGIGPTLDWHLSQRWELTADYDIQNYSDSNLVQTFNVRNIYKFTTAPRELRGILLYHFEDFSDQTIRNPVPDFLPGTIHPYFAPDLFSYVNAGLEWQHWLNPMTLGAYEFSYTVRYALQWDTLQVFYNTFGAALNWDFTDTMRLSVSTDHILSGEYDSSGVMATLMISLPGGRDFTPIRKTKKRSFAGMRSTTY
jgi:tetratricopeptide (TPR) repeat protein